MFDIMIMMVMMMKAMMKVMMNDDDDDSRDDDDYNDPFQLILYIVYSHHIKSSSNYLSSELYITYIYTCIYTYIL